MNRANTPSRESILEGQDSTIKQREFMRIQLTYARRYARVCGVPVQQALLECTRLYRQLGLPEVHGKLDETHPGWQEILPYAGDDSTLCQAVLSSAPNPLDDKGKACFRYEYNVESRTVKLHFANNDTHESGPLGDERLHLRREELQNMFREIQARYPDAEQVSCSSWIYAVPNFQALLPNSHLATMREAPYDTTGMAMWGQFIDRTGGLRDDKVRMFLQRVNSAINKQQLLGAFPVGEVYAESAIDDFYDNYLVRNFA